MTLWTSSNSTVMGSVIAPWLHRRLQRSLLYDQGMVIAVEMDVRRKDSNVIIVAKQGGQLL